MTDKTDTKKEAMLISLEKHKGIISHACLEVGVHRSTHYDWLKDPEYKRAYEEIEEGAIDHVESKLHELIDGVTIQKTNAKGEEFIYTERPDTTAVIFHLKTKGKKRGYIEKNVIEYSKTDTTKQYDFTKLSPEEVIEFGNVQARYSELLRLCEVELE